MVSTNDCLINSLIDTFQSNRTRRVSDSSQFGSRMIMYLMQSIESGRISPDYLWLSLVRSRDAHASERRIPLLPVGALCFSGAGVSWTMAMAWTIQRLVWMLRSCAALGWHDHCPYRRGPPFSYGGAQRGTLLFGMAAVAWW